jgi:outer membrane protein assembly factor BamB
LPEAKIAITPKTNDEPAALQPAPAAAKEEADWPGFRGPNRDGAIPGVRIETDWSKSPPVELWRRPIGPGWSSFAVHGKLLYTQEQRGDDEVVACYNLTTGEPVWRHRDAARFWESNAGAGPRSTPTLRNGRVYTFGATGILNALDARNGAVVWSRDAASDTGAKVPYWGFASSPLVVDDLVIVAASGQLAAYDLATGDPRWTGPAHGDSYSSPHRLTIDGVPQILLLSAAGATSVAPADGTLLWEHPWPGFSSLQPARTADGDVLITTSEATGGLGTRRLAVAHGPGKPLGQGSGLPNRGGPDGWTVTERWTSTGLKPYFNDFAINDGYAYGFDGRILACIDLADGQRKWKGGRYGNGQLILLPDQDLLLVLSDEGELALVEASPEKFSELARFPALEGKTWNHPVLAGEVLLVRNSQQMAAFQVALADD